MAIANSESADEHALLALARTGDHDAIATLYEQEYRHILAYACGKGLTLHDAEDVVSDTMLNWLRSLPTFVDRGVPLRRFLLRIAHARIVDRQRQALRRPTVALPEQVARQDMALLSAIVDQDTATELHAALDALTPEQRAVIHRRFVSHQSLATVAQELGLPITAVKSRQHRALAQLRQQVSR